ncbi:MAG: metallophosphoesterase family protein [Armatimonadota bacterium]
MRYGILSDIHANLPALEAAVEALRREGVDRFLCTGDLVGYGPHPNECVERVAELGAACVAGNHDLIALGRLTTDRCITLARDSLNWTREQLRDDTRAYLAALPERLEVEGGVVLAHGSLEDPQEYVTRPDQAEEQLALLDRLHPGARMVVLGHTHRAWAFAEGEGTLARGRAAGIPLHVRMLLNPGSVGQSRERRVAAQVLVLDLDREQAQFQAVPYDYARCREALLARGLPPKSCHLYPPPWRRVAGALYRRLARIMRSVRAMPQRAGA